MGEMNESDQTICEECGKILPKGRTHGLCAACLMGQAMASRTVVDESERPDRAAPLSPGEIADRFPQFEVTECLGRGGMGVVYKARQKSLDRWVAIKILAPGRETEERFAERFSREAQTLAKMSHPAIVTVFDHGETGGLFYIVMEYVDGVNLRDLLREGNLAAEQALAIVPPVCEALEYAHGKGVVHRDIKPENLLLDRDGRVKIADFGIASLVGASSEKSGTPPYMAPEQNGGTVDRRADIYALGVVLYEMLTGERPTEDLVAPSRKVEVDVRIDEMVLRALEKEPERRYQTAEEFRTVIGTIGPASKAGGAGFEGGARIPVRGAGPVVGSRFSRSAIVGACWASVFFIMLTLSLWTHDARVGPAGEMPPGPAWWQSVLAFTVLPLGLAAPFGTTIFGWIAVSRIRRSAGKIHGMGLAVFDGLLFPLLVLAGILGWICKWLIYDVVGDALMARQGELSTGAAFFLQNRAAVCVLACLVTVIPVCTAIIRRVWRAVKEEDSSPRSRDKGIGWPGVVALVVGIGLTIWLWTVSTGRGSEAATESQRDITLYDSPPGCLLDLDEGWVVGAPMQFEEHFGKSRPLIPFLRAGEEWIKKSGVDCLFRAGGKKLILLNGLLLELPGNYASVTDDEVRRAIDAAVAVDFDPSRSDPDFHMSIDLEPQGPAGRCWAFLTREGGMGVLRVSGVAADDRFADDGKSLRIRYRFLGESPGRGIKVRRLPGDGPDEVADFSGQELTEETIETLAAKPRLKRLDLQDSSIDDDDLARLAGLRELEWVNLAATLVKTPQKPGVSDDGLDHVAEWKKLRTLNLHGLPVTDEGIGKLGSLPALESLQLGGTRVTGEGLQGMRNLRWLRLDATAVTDDDLQFVGELRKLEQLYLDSTGISDAGLKHLEGLKRLRVLNLHNTKVTPAGVEALRLVLPELDPG